MKELKLQLINIVDFFLQLNMIKNHNIRVEW